MHGVDCMVSLLYAPAPEQIGSVEYLHTAMSWGPQQPRRHRISRKCRSAILDYRGRQVGLQRTQRFLVDASF